MSETPTFQIPKDVIEPIIQAHVAKAVVEALGGREAILEKAVHFAMNVLVDTDGKPSSYSSNAKPWLAYQMMVAIQKCAKAAIEEHLLAHSEIIKAQLAKEFAKKNSPLAKQLAAGMVGALANPDTLKWRLTVTADV